VAALSDLLPPANPLALAAESGHRPREQRTSLLGPRDVLLEQDLSAAAAERTAAAPSTNLDTSLQGGSWSIVVSCDNSGVIEAGGSTRLHASALSDHERLNTTIEDAGGVSASDAPATDASRPTAPTVFAMINISGFKAVIGTSHDVSLLSNTTSNSNCSTGGQRRMASLRPAGKTKQRPRPRVSVLDISVASTTSRASSSSAAPSAASPRKRSLIRIASGRKAKKAPAAPPVMRVQLGAAQLDLVAVDLGSRRLDVLTSKAMNRAVAGLKLNLLPPVK
jgi:hypothetical protein